MSMAHERHPIEELPAYALGALDEAERIAVAAHLERCDQCARDLAQFEDALYEAAAVGAVQVDVPRDLRARIVLRHRGARGTPESSWGGHVRAWLARPVPLAVPLALAILLVVSFVAVGTARREADTYAQALTGVADGRVVALAPQKNAPAEARGALVIPRSGEPYLVLRLSSPPTGKTWEAWVIKGQRPIAAGLNGSGGVFTIVLSAPVDTGDVVAVTLEPAAGSSTPTSDPVLAGGT
jgi:anti-sigma-K factor RskA